MRAARLGERTQQFKKSPAIREALIFDQALQRAASANVKPLQRFWEVLFQPSNSASNIPKRTCWRFCCN